MGVDAHEVDRVEETAGVRDGLGASAAKVPGLFSSRTRSVRLNEAE
jgi:hypothetical protein